MKRAVRAALQVQLGPTVTPEAPAPPGYAWTKGLGPFDLAVVRQQDPLAYIELKWSGNLGVREKLTVGIVLGLARAVAAALSSWPRTLVV